MIGGLSLLPAFAVRHPVCIRPSCTSWSRRLSRTAPGRGLDHAPPWWVTSPPPQGPSLGSGLFCPGPSSLNRPHHSQVHRDFTACRLIRDAFAVRERLGDPRAVPGFRCSFLPGMPSSPTPGRPTSKCSRASMPTWPSPFDHRLGTPKTPAIRSTRASHFVASLVRFRYGLPSCLPPCTDRTGTPALGDFYFQAFDGSVSLPAAGYNYNSDWTPCMGFLLSSDFGVAISLSCFLDQFLCSTWNSVSSS